MEGVKTVQEVGVEGILKTIDATKKLVDIVALVFEDGKVSVGDISKLPSLFVELKKVAESVKTVQEEAANLDAQEVKACLEAFVDLVLHAVSKFSK